MEIEKVKNWLEMESTHLNTVIPYCNKEVKLQLKDVLEGINNILLYLEEIKIN